MEDSATPGGNEEPSSGAAFSSAPPEVVDDNSLRGSDFELPFDDSNDDENLHGENYQVSSGQEPPCSKAGGSISSSSSSSSSVDYRGTHRTQKEAAKQLYFQVTVVKSNKVGKFVNLSATQDTIRIPLPSNVLINQAQNASGSSSSSLFTSASSASGSPSSTQRPNATTALRLSTLKTAVEEYVCGGGFRIEGRKTPSGFELKRSLDDGNKITIYMQSGGKGRTRITYEDEWIDEMTRLRDGC